MMRELFFCMLAKVGLQINVYALYILNYIMHAPCIGLQDHVEGKVTNDP